MNEHVSAWMGLALVQVWLYQMDLKRLVQNSWMLFLFYLLIFYFARGLQILCSVFSISFYEIPIFASILFLIFGRGAKGLVRFKKNSSEVPNFYLLTSLWAGLLWLGPFSNEILSDALKDSFFAIFFFLSLAEIKKRLELLDVPQLLSGLPILLISAGIFLLGFSFFNPFRN